MLECCRSRARANFTASLGFRGHSGPLHFKPRRFKRFKRQSQGRSQHCKAIKNQEGILSTVLSANADRRCCLRLRVKFWKKALSTLAKETLGSSRV